MSLLPSVGMFELMLLAAIALVVVGPKDLPRLMRAVGKFTAQARNMAMEFRAGFDQMAKEAEMEELRGEINALKKANPVNEIRDAVDEAMAPLKKDRSFDELPEPRFIETEQAVANAAKKVDGDAV